MIVLSIGLAQRARDLIQLSEWKAELMTAIDDLTASVKAAEARIDAAASLIPQLQTSVTTLQAQLAAAPNDSSILESLVAELNQHVGALASVLPESAPSPQAPTSGDTAQEQPIS